METLSSIVRNDMKSKEIYLDNAATTPVDERVLDVILPFFREHYGNPSSIHSIGQRVRKEMNLARQAIGTIIGANASEIYFTSGGSEANNWAIKGVAEKLSNKGKHIITTKIEHHSVINTCEFLEGKGFAITYLNVDKYGFVSLDELEKSICEDTILISVMTANNEIGTIEPIRQISEIAKKHGILFHTDAVQAFGHIDIDVNLMGIDLVSASSHKINGPKGVGFLYIRKGIQLDNLIHGGMQERGSRSGTENIPGIIGFAKAAELSSDEMNEKNRRIIRVRDYFISQITSRIPYSWLNGHADIRLANNVNVGFKYIDGESLVVELSNLGIYCSSGSACDSGSVEPSHVLKAVGLSHEDSYACVRMTIDERITNEDVDYVVEKLSETVAAMRNESPEYLRIEKNGMNDEDAIL